jgi:hypothetical protein
MARINKNINIHDSLYDDVCTVAEEMRVSQDELLVIAI